MAEKLEHAAKAGDTATIEKFHGPTVEKYRQLISDLSKYFPEEEKRIKESIDIIFKYCPDKRIEL